jgi:DNA uptake protein ComE-like DNA-binding protein
MNAPQVQHRTKGLCTVLNEFSTYLYLLASDGSKFESGYGDIIETFSTTTPVIVTPTPTIAGSPAQVQVNINDESLTATDLAELVRGIGRAIAKGIVNNRPSGGYTSIEHLVEVLTLAKVNFNQATIDAIKADNSLVFGNVVSE